MVKNMRLGLPQRLRKQGKRRQGSFCQGGTSRFLTPSFWQVPSEGAGGKYWLPVQSCRPLGYMGLRGEEG